MESLESLVCGVAGAGAGDRKVSCETVIAGGSRDASPPRMPPLTPPDPDFPPESITIPIGDEVAFSELNPIIYERDDSTKGSTNPKFAAASGAANPVAAKTRSNSTRVAATAPAAAGATFFGLPAKIRPPFTRRQPSQGRILPDKRGGSGSGRGDGEAEPRSPKVSCIGKVLSDRERHGRRWRSRRRGWWHCVAAMFQCDGCCRSVSGGGAAKKTTADDVDGGEELQPGIAGMRRFKSGRRAASWGDEALSAAAVGEEDETEKEQEQQQETEYRQETEQWVRRQVN